MQMGNSKQIYIGTHDLPGKKHFYRGKMFYCFDDPQL